MNQPTPDQLARVRKLIGDLVVAAFRAEKKASLHNTEFEKHERAKREFITANPGADLPASIRFGIEIAEMATNSAREELEDLHASIAKTRAALAAALPITTIFAIYTFTALGADGLKHQYDGGKVHDVLDPIAAAALDAGVAFLSNSLSGQRAIEDPYNVPKLVDLSDPCGFVEAPAP